MFKDSLCTKDQKLKRKVGKRHDQLIYKLICKSDKHEKNIYFHN